MAIESPLVMVVGERNKADRFETIYGSLKKGRKEKRKTILLLGPPGSGKSSLINSIVNYLHKVKESTPYRLHVTGSDRKTEDNSEKLRLDPTTSVSSYVFHGTRVSRSLALIDTPPLGKFPNGEDEENGEVPSENANIIREWYASNHKRSRKDNEVWLVISGQQPELTRSVIVDLKSIIEEFKSIHVKVLPVITFAKRRKPVLAMKALELLRLPTELENVDYFLVNNASVVETSDFTQTNALSYEEVMENIKSLLIAAAEPAVTIGSTQGSPLIWSPCSSDSGQETQSEGSVKSSEIPRGSSVASSVTSTDDHVYAIPSKQLVFEPQSNTSKGVEFSNKPTYVGNLVSISAYETLV